MTRYRPASTVPGVKPRFDSFGSIRATGVTAGIGASRRRASALVGSWVGVERRSESTAFSTAPSFYDVVRRRA